MSVVRTRASEMVLGAKRKAAQVVLSQALSLLSHSPDTGSRLLVQALYKIARNEQQHMMADWVARPCPIIDHPSHLRRAVALTGAKPTHEGAQSVVTDLAAGLDRYAHSVAEVYDPIWHSGHYNWVDSWLPTWRFPREVEGEAGAFRLAGHSHADSRN